MTDHHQPTPDDGRDQPPPPAPSDAESAPEGQAAPAQAAPGDTVGTGTSIALGCIAGTLLLVVIGLIFLLIVWLIA